MSIKLVDLLLASFVAAIFLAWAHAYDWKVIGGKKPNPPWCYVIGVVLMEVPLLALLAYWKDWWACLAVVAVTMGSGLPVLFGYNIRGQTNKTNYEMLLSEHLADEREISQRLQRNLMKAEREKAALIAECSTQRRNDDG